ncbi:cation-dependent mannose-6-phosphate receptor [Rhinatrema bivittatum]|uniref:cation-dependent mannose-6-phosphate receptor n=1 Tax=Rhinatrema bivittatum TaxID=194408 RepID=UPI00112E410A|nr:cation-dependent mannose-6-phosphate receptor [Rhinatrema bivittatum]XP_029436369.1 cation-dependent mannose-6-phosphate receptor [Rhinatrema bivittatum]
MSPCGGCVCALAALLTCLVLVSSAAGDPVAATCDLVGNSDKESAAEKAVIQKLAPLTPLVLNTTVRAGNDTYIYSFRVCGTIGKEASAGLVQFNNLTKMPVVVGRITETHVFSGSDWILLTYRGGDVYSSHCSKEPRKAMVMISCDRNTLADGFTLMNEENTKETDCFYLFEMNSKLACAPEDSRLSVGSVLLIVVACFLAVYLIGGFLYQRLVVGAKGMDQFPNYNFWQDLGSLAADGCDFMCRAKPRNTPASYRGVGDEQLGEEPEERDDHLLPM